ncbi:MAG: hypothetical protein J6S82_08330, partial [Bacteroidales bacterium]|nr:hypothetical protein [Bacteroidales bacterium]
AQLKEGRTDMAYFLYSLINPAHRTQTLADVLKYKVEPYCIAADIYSNPQHPGRGGWTWYTGSASWAYKVGIEHILGFRKEGDTLAMEPHTPLAWKEFALDYRFHETSYHICCKFRHEGEGLPRFRQLLLDERPLPDDRLPLQNDGGSHSAVWIFE